MSRKQNLVKISREFYMTTYLIFYVSVEIKSPQNRCLRLECHHNVTTAKEIYASRERVNSLRYVKRALSVLLGLFKDV
jgi:hypothetical protein